MSLNKAVLDIRNRQRVKPSPFDVPAASWTGRDVIESGEIDTITVIFKTSGCWWGKAGGCTMCGYVYDSAQGSPSDDDLMAQLEKAMRKVSDLDRFMVKIFTSGSFLDTKEIPLEVRHRILEELDSDERIIKVLAETRPEFVTKENVRDCVSTLKNTDFEVAMGLETSSDVIRKQSINKGFTFRNFVDAAKAAKENGATVKSYLMLKPPFLSEKEALEDIVQTIHDAAEYTDTFSINLCNVQRGTYVEHLWDRKQYRPPWLWSIVDILQRTKKEFPDMIITSDPVGAGSKRGPHNCRECSHTVADAIRLFSLTQDLSCFEHLSCDCMDLWEQVLELEDHTFGSPILD
ncbi:archaeosine biosynthesis radical SAM protein RaSEA [Methanolobus bombayensis]|uniref:archaeosine biosynthesis radical SAM protein RaSEA n=1 Tax=Methanolobus bombayensis TaxID=38023 RepID=UPI001AE89DDF|nr:archaeosine biosynthesis radical SAM protein RaSEA [Methanolobus bombayensis]MBP1910573.1 radical SAM enzyme (TIGR01210 family) [Methanolobus bombayensis]